MASEFLEVPDGDSLTNSLLAKISEAVDSISLDLKDEVKVKAIKPTPGLCIKAKAEDNSKVFINICYCPEVPQPADITEEELSEILKSDEPSSYRVPLSIGEAHQEKDKNEAECTCYDVVINSEFFGRLKKSQLFREFVISLCFETVQDKYNLNLQSDSCIVLRNKQYHGKMPSHFIRDRPLIAELGSDPLFPHEGPEYPETENTGVTRSPEYILRKKPADGIPTQLVLDVLMPEVESGESVSVSIGEDRIVIYEPQSKYSVDFFFPYLVVQETCTAEFDIGERVLTVTMPVAQNEVNSE